MTVEQALQGVTAAFLDSAPVIYHVEHHPRYAAVMRLFLRVRAQERVTLFTSPVTLAECLVQPVRKGRDDLVASYTETLLHGEGIEFRVVGGEEALLAAEIRAQHGLRLPDALQVAVARLAGCEAILTNDTDFRRVDHPRAIILDDLVGDDAT